MIVSVRTIFLFLAVMAVVVACRNQGDKDAWVVSVGEKNLTWKQLEEIIPNNSSAEDSIKLAERYIEDWIREQVVLVQAEQNLSEEQQQFDHLIENYRKSLVTYAYENALVRQKLDTLVSDGEIERYYDENKSNFQLKDYIVKVKFCAAPRDLKQMKTLKKLFNSSDPSDLVKWQQFCVENNASFFFEEDTWLRWDELVKQVPLNVYDIEAFLRSNRNVEFEKDGNLYLLNIVEYQLSGSISPLSFEKEKIRALILNKRKLDLLNQMRVDLYNQAQGSDQIKYYYKKQ